MADYIKTGVIGHPVSHSLSPLIHGYWIKTYGLSGSYEALDVPEGALAEHVKRFLDQGYSGFNVTLPHKQAALDLCDTLDSAAQAIGAVNTLIWRDGKLHGANTDAAGFITNIREQKPGFDFSAGPALALGAGGAARAIIYSLKEAGVPDIRITNRTAEKADALAAEFGITALPWHARADYLGDISLLINTTSLGMTGKPALTLDLSALAPHALVTDIVYNPLRTTLLEAAAARGNPVVDGLGMLLHQAVPGFKAWFGVKPKVTPKLREILLEALK